MPHLAQCPLAVVAWIGAEITITAAVAQSPRQLDVDAIRAAAGTTVTVTDDGVARIGWSRDDVAVTIDGMPFRPQAGLGSWAAFTTMPDGMAMVMGDTVVFEDEITPAMNAALGHGLDVTALHNHFILDRPPVYFMHVGGTGEEAALANGVRSMWDAIRAVRREHAEPRPTFGDPAPDQTGDFDVAGLERLLGATASVANGVAKFTFGRAASMHGVQFGASMGLATWAAFSGNRQDAVVDGDFAMTAGEVQAVLRSLCDSGIHVVALHNHMIGETPAFYFLHFWGRGTAEHLARELRRAMDEQAQAGTATHAHAAAQTGGRFAWHFDDVHAGRLPAGWRSEATNPDGQPNPWSVVAEMPVDAGGQVLSLPATTRFRSGTFNLCWTDRVSFGDGRVSVKVRAGQGRVDRGGGPIWRVQDADNYYVARWNPLEDNFRVYFVRNGKRVQLASADVQADPAQWHTITIEHHGSEIVCALDGQALLHARDATIPGDGGVGVWTKADAASSFDDFEVETEAKGR